MKGMTTTQHKLLQVLESCPGTADFLIEVQRTIERFYAEHGDSCPAGFEALDSAIAAFEVADKEQA